MDNPLCTVVICLRYSLTNVANISPLGFYISEIELVYNIYYDKSHPLHAPNVRIIEEVIEQLITRDLIFHERLVIDSYPSIQSDIILQESQSGAKNQVTFDLDNLSKHYSNYTKKFSRGSDNSEKYPPNTIITQAQKDFMWNHYSQGENQTNFVQSIFGYAEDKCPIIDDMEFKGIHTDPATRSDAVKSDESPSTIKPETSELNPEIRDDSSTPKCSVGKNSSRFALCLILAAIGAAICATIIYRFKSAYPTGSANIHPLMKSNDVYKV